MRTIKNPCFKGAKNGEFYKDNKYWIKNANL